ncbi:hypothetical protein Plhal304r1_c040g0118181 [Plasmopara halstedii]
MHNLSQFLLRLSVPSVLCSTGRIQPTKKDRATRHLIKPFKEMTDLTFVAEAQHFAAEAQHFAAEAQR